MEKNIFWSEGPQNYIGFHAAGQNIAIFTHFDIFLSNHWSNFRKILQICVSYSRLNAEEGIFVFTKKLGELEPPKCQKCNLFMYLN